MSQPVVNCEIVNMAEFQQVFSKALSLSSRTLAQGMNSKMFFIARGASRLTPKADRSKFEQELGVVGYAVKVGKKGRPLMRNGKARWERQYSRKVTLANLIINSRKGYAGKKGLYGMEMRRAVVDMIKKRGRSAGTLKAGWLGAIKTFASAAGETSNVAFEQLASFIKGRTKTKVARDSFTPEASMEYLTNSFKPFPDHTNYIDPKVRRALAQAYADELRSMQQYIISKMQKAMDSISKP